MGRRADVAGIAGAAALLAAAFVATERLVRNPILPLGTFRIPGLVAANLTGLVGFAGMLTMFCGAHPLHADRARLLAALGGGGLTCP